MISGDFEVDMDAKTITPKHDDRLYTLDDFHAWLMYAWDLEQWRERKTPRRAARIATSIWRIKAPRLLPRVRLWIRWVFR